MNTTSLSLGALALTLLQPIAASAEVTFPANVQQSCPVSAQMLAGWFSAGHIAANGPVGPADGLIFPPVQNTTCDFYRWGAQMFLWLTSSEIPAVYTFDGPHFYDVVSSGSGYAFEQNTGPAPNPMGLRAVKSETIGGTGQAGGDDVLISQAGALTYYGIHTNDIYASYLTLQKQGTFADTPIAENFPSSEADMMILEKAAGTGFTDPEAMTMELKTSWVDASTVNASRYLTILAEVPAFDTSDPTHWIPDGTTTMELALVGMHIAAPVNGHPELVWSSFEHIDNSPNATYYYMDTAGTVAMQGFDSSGNWTFFPEGGAPVTEITSVASTQDDGSILAESGDIITAVSAAQLNPWGLAPEDQSVAEANSDLVSLNLTLLGQLQNIGDVRGNYYQIGGIWTVEGQIPTGDSDPNIRGGDRLANSTMETFHQYPNENNGFTSKNCFLCHSTSKGDGIDLSHIFGSLQPLDQ